ncbi:amidase [Peribacillus deserti]|uniref:Amidase n=1 Tax=Peribacillus deserti TaxID=673318 RepID=A0A2N5M658_9BACI|nr:amidase [Peribacillus deserti]PLT29812.1 amidase [Peribacillus deserti]
MSLSNDLSYMSVAELSSKILRKQLSPVDVIEAVITRIKERNESLNAFVHVDFEGAKEMAKKAEAEIMSGAEVGIMHGIPSAIKDLFDFKPGWPSTFGGIRALKHNITDFYCPYAERMEKSGAILVGKTNSPVMGFRGTCDNYLFGPSRNPFNLRKNTGGSSGGSAAAVADGLLPIAEGTDGGGSIRIPAAWCGLYGYKASFGRVPSVARPNAFGGINPFLFEGTLTRNVEDAAIGLTALAGYDPRDPFSLDENVNYLSALRKSVKGMRIAFSPDFDVFPVDNQIAETVRNAVKVFEQAGAHVEEVKFGINRDQRELSDLWCRLITPINIDSLEGLKAQGIDILKDHSEDLPPEYRDWIEKGYKMNVLDLNRDQHLRTEIYDAIQNILNKYDLIITPTVASLPVDNTNDGNTKGPTQINGVEVDPLIGWCLTYFTNFTGHPSASIPAGLSKENLPIGMQIIGRRYADTDVLAASSVFERMKPWNHIYDICKNRDFAKVLSN